MKRLIVVAVLALAACGQEAQQRETSDADPVAVSSSTSAATIGPNGAAGISTAIAMNVDAVRAAAPSFAVAEVDDQVEGNPFKAITLSTGAQEMFRILPTADRAHAHAIVTRSPQVRSSAGEVVGQAKFAVAPPEEVSFCTNEFVDGAAGFACSTAVDGSFWRVYRLPEGAEPAASYEEIEPDLLHDATLVEMRWIAPRV